MTPSRAARWSPASTRISVCCVCSNTALCGETFSCARSKDEASAPSRCGVAESYSANGSPRNLGRWLYAGFKEQVGLVRNAAVGNGISGLELPPASVTVMCTWFTHINKRVSTAVGSSERDRNKAALRAVLRRAKCFVQHLRRPREAAGAGGGGDRRVRQMAALLSGRPGLRFLWRCFIQSTPAARAAARLRQQVLPEGRQSHCQTVNRAIHFFIRGKCRPCGGGEIGL